MKLSSISRSCSFKAREAVVFVGVAAGLGGCATGAAVDADGGFRESTDSALGGRADADLDEPDGAPSLFPDAGPTPDAAPANDGPCTPVARNLLANGNFDESGGWTETSGGGFAILVNESELGDNGQADSGDFLAWLGGYSQANAVDTMWQEIVVPADASPQRLVGKMWIDSAESNILAWDTFTLEVLDTSDTVLETLGNWSNLDEGTGWESFSIDLATNYAGQTIRLRWTARLDSTNTSNFLLDTLELSTMACP